MIGRTISHFEILEELGAGGMGVVYKARDTQLDRLVALKFLPPHSARQPDRVMRFLQEARAASALNHPNIITIHEIGSFEDTEFIAMEFVRGKNLDQLIGKKGLRLNETLKYAIQITDALAKAHAAGIVHRDLKPANIMVTDEGLVKVLDFGLAKLSEQAVGQFAATATMKGAGAAQTDEGTILGTIAYMSPEQAEGRSLDARSDIFSFGSVLYEMMTGRVPFQRESKLSTLSAILRDDPKPLSQVGCDAPNELDRIVTRCLRKDPDRRFQHMDDLKVALLDLKEDSESGKFAGAPTTAQRRRLRWILPAAVTALALCVAAIFFWQHPRTKPVVATGIKRLTFDSGLTTNPTISPDGKLLAYASDRNGKDKLDIYVQQIPGGTPVRLTNDEADDYEPSFSPDGSKIVFRSQRAGGGIYVIPVLGGEERLLAPDGDRPRFSPDGNWVAYHVGAPLRPCAIYVVAATGGRPRKLQTDVPWTYGAIWSPDGKYLIFQGTRDPFVQVRYDWWVAPAVGGPAVPTGVAALLEGQLGLASIRFGLSDWLPDGSLLFSAGSIGENSSIWTVPISGRTFKVSGSPQRLTQGSGREFDAHFAAGPGGASRYVFSSEQASSDLWTLPVNADEGRAVGELRRLNEGAAENIYPTLSGDGKKLVFVSNRSASWQVWLRDMETGKETALTTSPDRKLRAIVSPDGSKVVYVVRENSKNAFWVMPLTGVGDAKELCEDCGGVPVDWTPDGNSLIYYRDKPIRYLLMDAESGRTTDLLRHPKYDLHRVQFSPDGKWLAFNPKIGPRKEPIYVAPYRQGVAGGENGWIEITDGSGYDGRPMWAPSGNLLYFVSSRDGFQCIWAHRLDLSSKRPFGAAMPVLHFHSARRPLNETLGVFLGRDQIVMTLPEYRGNIWMTDIAK